MHFLWQGDTMNNLEVQQRNCDSLDNSSGSDILQIFRQSSKAILTARRLLHNLLNAQFSEEGSNRRIFKNEKYDKFVREFGIIMSGKLQVRHPRNLEFFHET